MKATRMLLWSEMNPIMAGEMGQPMIEATNKDDPSFVYRPSCLMLSAKMVGNMIEWKKPIRTTAHRGATPEPRRTTKRQTRVESENNESSRAAGIRFMM